MTEPNDVFEAMCKAAFEDYYEVGDWDHTMEAIRTSYREGMRAALRAARELGWKMVPRDATQEMSDAALTIDDRSRQSHDEVWEKRWDAAPDILAEGE